MPLNRRTFLRLSATSGITALAAPQILATGPAEALYTNSVVIDGLGFPGSMDTDEGAALSAGEVADVADSGLTALHLTVGGVGTMTPLAAFEKIVRDLARWESEIDRNPDVFSRIRGASDIRLSKITGRTGLVYGLQDGVAFEDDLDRLRALQQLGVRIIQPTYNRRNLLGDGCMEPADSGMSRTGQEAVELMNDIGILIDLSHCGRRTAADAIAASVNPVSFTHTGCHALAEHPRHRTDQEMRAVAKTGGVIGIFIMPYLARGRQPTAADVIAHLDHAIDVAGEDHVSLGTDGLVSPSVVTAEYAERFREMTRKRKERGIAAPFETEEGYLFADDLNTPRRLETLADLLLAHGHGERRVEKILGANLLRLFDETWAA